MCPNRFYITNDDDIEPFIKKTIIELEALFQLNKKYDEKDYFNQLSHTKFALNMLLKEIEKRRDILPSVVVERFAKRMNRYSCENIETSYIFSVAYDTAQNILFEYFHF